MQIVIELYLAALFVYCDRHRSRRVVGDRDRVASSEVDVVKLWK